MKIISVAAILLSTSALAAPTETELYKFCSQPNCADGSLPGAGLLAGDDGSLYGTTESGGSSDHGTVFKLTPPSLGHPQWTETVLYSFKDIPDGSIPLSSLIADKQGALYGTTGDGGAAGGGAVFKLTPPNRYGSAWVETVLYSFKGGSDGFFPMSGLIMDKEGALYGATVGGGGPKDDGTVFKLTPPSHGQTAWTETVLYSFGDKPDGANPASNLVAGKDGYLYGTTEAGGNDLIRPHDIAGEGTVFKLALPRIR